MPRLLDLPDDIEALKRLVLKSYDEADATRATLIIEQLKNEDLRFELACLKRARYGRYSERLDDEITQLELTVEDLEASVAAAPAAAAQQAATDPRIAAGSAARADRARDCLQLPGLWRGTKNWLFAG